MCGSVSGGGVCYSGDSVGSVAVYFCDDGYTLEGDTTRECLSNGVWSGSTPQCMEASDGKNIHCSKYVYLKLPIILPADSEDISTVAAIVIGVVCSVVFLILGLLLGVVGLYLIQRVRGKSSGSTTSSSSCPPLPPSNPPRRYVQTLSMKECQMSVIAPADAPQQTGDEGYEPMATEYSEPQQQDYEEPVATSIEDVSTSQRPIYEPVYY